LEWIEVYREAWRERDTDRLLEWVHPDARILYPLMPEPVDRNGLASYFASGFAAMPDFRIEPVRWAAHGHDMFVEWRARGTAGAERLEWSGTDRFTFRGDLIVEAFAYADPAPLAAAMRAARAAGNLRPAEEVR
jgi:hypothetical protein